MGRYLNQGNENFQKSINSEIYVDKTGLIAYTNRVINTLQGYACISRPRRFGVSVCGYYYCKSLEAYEGNIFLVGVNYNKKTKVHECRIEEYEKKFETESSSRQ